MKNILGMPTQPDFIEYLTWNDGPESHYIGNLLAHPKARLERIYFHNLYAGGMSRITTRPRIDMQTQVLTTKDGMHSPLTAVVEVDVNIT